MKLTTEDYELAVEEHKGYCTECNKLTADRVEGDAEGYDCPECENETVMGIENALVEGLVVIDDEDGDLEDSDDIGYFDDEGVRIDDD